MNALENSILKRIEAVEATLSDNIFDLMKSAGLTNKSMFRGGDWSASDFSNQDLQGYDFSECILTGATFRGSLVNGCIWVDCEGLDLEGAIEGNVVETAPSIFEFERRMRAAPNYAEAEKVYQAFRLSRHSLTIYFLNAMMSKATTLGQLKHAFSMFNSGSVVPDKFSYGMIIKVAKTEADAYEWGSKMMSSGAELDTRSFNGLLAKLRNPELIQTVVTEMAKRSVDYDTFTYNILIKTSPSEADARALFVKMLRGRLKPDVVTFRNLISKFADFEDRKTLVINMSAHDVAPDVTVFNSLLLKGKYSQIDDVFALMEAHQVKPDVFAMNVLVHRAKNFRDATAVLHARDFAGLVPDDYTLNHLTKKTVDKTDLRTVLRLRSRHKVDFTHFAVTELTEAMERLGYPVTAILQDLRRFKSDNPCLLGARLAVEFAGDLQEAIEWLKVFGAGHKSYSESSAIALIHRIRFPKDAVDLISELQLANIYHKTKFFDNLYDKLASHYSADSVLAVYADGVNKSPESLKFAIRRFLIRKKKNYALRISLSFPYLWDAQKAIRASRSIAVGYFENFLVGQEHDATYALGYTYKILGNSSLAIEYFSRARALANISKRIEDIDEQLKQLGAI